MARHDLSLITHKKYQKGFLLNRQMRRSFHLLLFNVLGTGFVELFKKKEQGTKVGILILKMVHEIILMT